MYVHSVLLRQSFEVHCTSTMHALPFTDYRPVFRLVVINKVTILVIKIDFEVNKCYT